MNACFDKLDKDQKNQPVCLIVDEVDGAMGGGSGSENAKGI